MIVYVLPGAGIYGGIKVGVQFVDLLRSLGVDAVVATPEGAAPQWCRASAPVVVREQVLGALTAADTVIFSLPHDHDEVRATPARAVFHCQGTDPRIVPVLEDPAVALLTCWDQATRFVADTVGRRSIEVGISIADVFLGGPRHRVERSVAHMARRGRTDAVGAIGGVHHVVVDGDPEAVVAAKLQAADVFVAVAEHEWFGLPALEAMAAGCAVVSVRTVGGGEYLRDGHNALVVDADEIPAAVSALLDDDARRGLLRRNGLITAQRYRRALQAERLAALLDAELGEILGCR